jgi:hypothetical protein
MKKITSETDPTKMLCSKSVNKKLISVGTIIKKELLIKFPTVYFLIL